MTKANTQPNLAHVQDALLVEMSAMQARLPSDIENVSEAFERYARIIALLVRSLDVLSRLERLNQKELKETGDPQTRHALISDIEQKLGRLAQQVDAPASAECAE